MYDQKNAQSMGFLIIWGTHSWAMTSRKTYVDEIERFQVIFLECEQIINEVNVYSNNGYFYILDVFFLWKYSSRSRSSAF